MDPLFVPMRDEACEVSAGAHCSDGWDVDTPWHRHDMHQLLYAFEGSVEIEGEGGRRYKAPRQFAAWIPAGAVHRTRIQKVASGSVFFTPALVPCDDGALRVITAPPLMRQMVMHAMRWPLDRRAEATSTVYFDCLARLCREWIEGEVRLVLPASDDPRIRAIMAFTEANLAAVTMPDVCRHAAMSDRSLRRRFGEATGMSWEEYRLRLRICRALDALERTDRPVGQIAADLGYDDQAAFARMFRAIIGLSPRAYRQSKAAWDAR